MKLFKQRFGGYETLVQSEELDGHGLLVWAVEAGRDYRLYGYGTDSGPLEPVALRVPAAGQWSQAVMPMVAVRSGLKGGLRWDFAGEGELHVMFRERRLTSGQALPELLWGEWLKPAFAAGALLAASQWAPSLSRFKHLYQVRGAQSAARLWQLAEALEQRADVEYSSLDPVLASWQADRFTQLVGSAGAGVCLVAPWQYSPRSTAVGTSVLRSKLIWDCMLGCAQAEAPVFYAAGAAAVPGWGDNGAIGVRGVASASDLQGPVAELNRYIARWRQYYHGSYLPPAAFTTWLGGQCDAQALQTLVPLLAR